MSYQNSKKLFYGYVTPRDINGMMIPITLQHLTLNDYCTKNKATYKLPVAELVSENSFFQFFSLLNSVKNKTNIVMCSFFMLPHHLKDIQNLKKILKKKKITIHCVLENLIVSTTPQLDEITTVKNLVRIVENNENINLRKFIN